MLDAELVHETGHFSYADAEHLADLWNRAYPVMRQIATLYIEGMRAYIEREGWVIDPAHRHAEVLQAYTTPEKKARRKLKLAEELRRDLGQLDRGTHKLCTRSPGGFTVTGAYMAVRNLLNISSLSSEGLASVFRLAAELAEAEERVNEARKKWHQEQEKK
jgi:hypothetical protein